MSCTTEFQHRSSAITRDRSHSKPKISASSLLNCFLPSPTSSTKTFGLSRSPETRAGCDFGFDYFLFENGRPDIWNRAAAYLVCSLRGADGSIALHKTFGSYQRGRNEDRKRSDKENAIHTQLAHYATTAPVVAAPPTSGRCVSSKRRTAG